MKDAICKKAQLENTEKMESVMSKISGLFDDFSKGKEKLLLRASEREKNVTESILADISRMESKSKSTLQMQMELKMRLQIDSQIQSKCVDNSDEICEIVVLVLAANILSLNIIQNQRRILDSLFQT